MYVYSALEFMADGSISNGLRSILGKDIFGPVSDTAVVSITDIETIILDETQGDADVKPEGNAESADDMGAQFYPTPTQVMDMTDSDALEEVLGVGTGQAPVDGVDEGDMDDDNNDSGGGQEDSKNVQYVTTSIEEGEEEDIVMEDGEEAS